MVPRIDCSAFHACVLLKGGSANEPMDLGLLLNPNNQSLISFHQPEQLPAKVVSLKLSFLKIPDNNSCADRNLPYTYILFGGHIRILNTPKPSNYREIKLYVQRKIQGTIEESVGREFWRTVGRTLNIHLYALFLDACNGLFNADIFLLLEYGFVGYF